MTRSLVLVAALLVAVALPHAQSASDLFQKALSKERVDGQLTEAIALYERVVREAAGDRALQAKALLQMARGYERLGRGDARKIYERIARDFTDQTAAVADARARLAATAPRDAGGSGRALWTGEGVDPFGSISPDGRYLSFTDWDSGDLSIRDLTAGRNRRLTNKGSWDVSSDHAEFSAIARDGRTIAYAWCGDDGCELRTVSRAGGAPRVLYRNRDVSYVQPFDWSADGRSIVALLTKADRTHQLAIISVADGAVRVLKTFDWRQPWKAALSPDAAYVAYDLPSTPDAPERDIFVLAVDGSREAVLIEHRAHDVLLGWRPESDRVYFASDRIGTNGIWTVRVEQGRRRGEAEIVRPGVGQIAALNFTDAGDFVYALSTARTDVRIGAFDAAAGTLGGRLRRSNLASNRDGWRGSGHRAATTSPISSRRL